ncbi:MAG: NAD(+) diphosphatase [Gammaproteobacteria bacterium]|nr:NAD(+) diphosphatase [Gammaproteobacteria bacterium]
MTQRSFFPGIGELTDDDQFVLFHERQLLVRGESFVWSRSELEFILLDDTEILLIDEQAGASLIAVNAKQDITQLLQAEKRPLRSLLTTHAGQAFSMAGKANQVLEWYASHRFCGICGNPTVHHPAQRALVCSSCEQQFFPRINPCAIMLVVKDDEILLARNARFKSGYYSCLSGFMEVGETPEQTVVREVREEVGVEVENVRYAKSQSWPFPSQLMLGFYADYKSGDITPDGEEIDAAGWFNVNRLPPVPPPNVSVAGELIQDYVTHARNAGFEK